MSTEDLNEAAPSPLSVLTERANSIGRCAYSSFRLNFILLVTNCIDPSDTSSPPLQNAIAFMDDPQELEKFIRDFHSLEPTSINQKDHVGLTPIYVAAMTSNLAAIRTLLDLGIDMAALRTRENADRVSILMTLQDNLRTTREYINGETIYIGANPCKASLVDELEIERRLKEAIGDCGASVCSCNMCDDRWLSQKMRARLHSGLWCTRHICC